jgi:hypothetical protein
MYQSGIRERTSAQRRANQLLGNRPPTQVHHMNVRKITLVHKGSSAILLFPEFASGNRTAAPSSAGKPAAHLFLLKRGTKQRMYSHPANHDTVFLRSGSPSTKQAFRELRDILLESRNYGS